MSPRLRLALAPDDAAVSADIPLRLITFANAMNVLAGKPQPTFTDFAFSYRKAWHHTEITERGDRWPPGIEVVLC